MLFCCCCVQNTHTAANTAPSAGSFWLRWRRAPVPPSPASLIWIRAPAPAAACTTAAFSTARSPARCSAARDATALAAALSGSVPISRPAHRCTQTTRSRALPRQGSPRWHPMAPLTTSTASLKTSCRRERGSAHMPGCSTGQSAGSCLLAFLRAVRCGAARRGRRPRPAVKSRLEPADESCGERTAR